MTTNFVFIGVALLLLFFGAESLVRGSASLALRSGLSPLLVGLTVVAFGTSSPELVVSVQSALSHQGDISVGNVIGSNTFNIAVILGLTALICPIPVHAQITRVDGPIALVVALLIVYLLLDDTLGRIEGALLFTGIFAYVWMNVVQARREAPILIGAGPGEAIPGVSRHWAIDVAFIVAGLGLLVWGSRLLVAHAVAVAQAFGVSEAIIGLTIVAAGTSMPELATSLVAAIRKQPDIAIGNIVGSNIFNILGILGLAALIEPLYAPGVSTLDYAAMVLFSVLLLPLLYSVRILHRVEGALLLSGYGVYLFLLWPR